MNSLQTTLTLPTLELPRGQPAGLDNPLTARGLHRARASRSEAAAEPGPGVSRVGRLSPKSVKGRNEDSCEFLIKVTKNIEFAQDFETILIPRIRFDFINFSSRGVLDDEICSKSDCEPCSRGVQ